MYYTQHKIEAIFSRRKPQFFFLPWDAVPYDINTEDISNHTLRKLCEEHGKILDGDEVEDHFNTGILNPKDYYLRVF